MLHIIWDTSIPLGTHVSSRKCSLAGGETHVPEMGHSMGLHLYWVANYLPRANPVERKLCDLKQKLAIMLQSLHMTWGSHLSSICWAMNSVPSSITRFSPILLTFGREPRQPWNSVVNLNVFCHFPSFIRTCQYRYFCEKSP